MVILFALTAFASGLNNPGGDRIPYVKLQSKNWDIVIRMTGEGRARVERLKARCKPNLWVNGCAPGVDPELRQIAMNGVFQEPVQLSGDFSYCSTALVRGIPKNLARDLIRANPDPFCKAFLDPESVRNLRSGNATAGENDLVNRLMGGRNTTSGKIRMKAPPTLQGSAPLQEEREATGERRTALATENNRRKPVAEPVVEPVVPAAPPAPPADLLEDEEKQQIFNSPEPPPPPPPDPVDAELAELLAPLPGLPERDQVGVPAPVPQPTRSMSELERLDAENDALMRMSQGNPEDDGKKKRKDKAKKVEVGTDEDFGDYIIIDIESLPD